MADFRQQVGDVVIKAASTSAAATDGSMVVALSPNSPITLPAFTKGVQGLQAVTTQAIKDSGRVNVAITCYQAAGIAITEALFAAGTFSLSRDGATPTTGQQFTVTAGKRFSIQAITISIKDGAAAALTSKIAFRYSAVGGAITTTSPTHSVWDLGTGTLTTGTYIGPYVVPFPDGTELISGSTFGFTNLSSAATALHTITINGYEY